MKKILIIIIIAIVCATAILLANNLQLFNSENDKAHDVIATETIPSPTALAEDKPNIIKEIFLDIPEPINKDLQYITENNTYKVILTDEVYNDESAKNSPTMPTYQWHINYIDDYNIESIILEFDLFDVANSDNDPELNGFERGFFVGTLNACELNLKFGNGNDNVIYDEAFYLSRPYYMTDMIKYAVYNNSKVTVTIPYEQFVSGANDLWLQFLPEAEYGNINIYLKGENLNNISVKELTKSIEIEYKNPVIKYINPDKNSYTFNQQNPGWYGGYLESNKSVNKSSNFRREYYNDDGSVNMVISDFNIEGFDNDIDCQFGIVPEGLYSALYNNSLTRNESSMLAKFVYNNMRDKETGLIYGIWDCENNKLIAEGRSTPNLPLLLIFRSYLADYLVIDMFESIIENEIEYVNGKPYYAPSGINNGILELSLSDLIAVNTSISLEGQWQCAGLAEFVNYIDDYNVETKKLAVFIQAIANSYALVLEGQENNPTHLPCNSISISFNDDGTYSISNVNDEFYIADPFFQIGRGFRFDRWYIYSDLWKYWEGKENYIHGDLENIENNYYSLELYRNIVAINFYQHKIFYHIYNFSNIQDENTRLAPGYNIITGEAIFNNGTKTCGFYEIYNRFGTPKDYISWYCIAAPFVDENMLAEVEALCGEFMLNIEIGIVIDTMPDLQGFIECGKQNISISEDINYMMYFTSGQIISAIFPAQHPPEAESMMWRESSVDLIRHMYYSKGIDLSQNQEELLDKLFSEPIY